MAHHVLNLPAALALVCRGVAVDSAMAAYGQLARIPVAAPLRLSTFFDIFIYHRHYPRINYFFRSIPVFITLAPHNQHFFAISSDVRRKYESS